MRDPAAGGVRALRAGVATAVVVALSAAGHVAGGGAAEPAVLVVLVSLVAPVCWAAARRRLGPARLLALLLGGQVLMHAALTTMAPASSGTAGHLTAHLTGHAHGAVPALPGAVMMGAGAAATPSVAMLGAHLVASVLAALVLARGEALLWAVARRLLPPLPRPVWTPRTVRLPALEPPLLTATAPASALRARGPPHRS